MELQFSEAVSLVASLEKRGWRLDLDRMQELVSRLHIVHWPKFVHIAGTNGKGSVTAYVQSILVQQGWKTGAYFSPFVFDIRERIQFESKDDSGIGKGRGRSSLIPESDFSRIVDALWSEAESMSATEVGGPTEFEFKTAMGFQFWAEKNADYVALEVGLGGRLDATNVVDPACSVIVNIGLDHMEILGNTHAEIAIEKAGIIKPGRPVVVGEVPEEAWLAIETIAKVNQAPIWKFGRDFVLSAGFDGYRVSTPGGSYERLTPGISGVAQPHNMAVAIAACEAAGGIIEPRKVPHGVAKAFAPGRMQRAEYKGKHFLLDGAHNADAARNLVESIQVRPEGSGTMVLLTGMLEGHKPGDIYEPLATLVDEAHFVPIDFHRSRRPDDLISEAGWLFERSSAHQSLQQGLEACLVSPCDTILITGSFYLVGEVGRMIGLG